MYDYRPRPLDIAPAAAAGTLERAALQSAGVEDASVRLALATDPAEIEQIGALRRRVYASKNPEVLATLDESGLDAYDATSLHVVAYDGEGMIAAVRANLGPFECERLLAGEARLLEALGRRDDLVEISRLLVSGRRQGVSTAISAYLGLTLLVGGSYRRYVAYATDANRRRNPYMERGTVHLEFALAERNMREYGLLLGSFEHDVALVVHALRLRASDALLADLQLHLQGITP